MTADAVGGVWTYCVDLCRALSDCGVEVVVATMGPRPSTGQRQELAELDKVELRESDFDLEWMDEPWTDVEQAGRWLMAIEREVQPDLVHLNGYAHAALPWRQPVVVVAHSCVVSWWQAVHGESPPPRYDRYREVVGDGLAHASLVVAPTSAMLRSICANYQVERPTRVLYNGRHGGAFRAGRPLELVLSAGRIWDEAKNIVALDRAAEAIPWPVLIAGSTRHPDGHSQAPDRASALGSLSPDRLREWMASASIYALPALYEPFGLSALEAALSGCALVLGDIESLHEVWGEAAIYVPPRRPDRLAEAVCQLIADPARRADMADRARNRACRYDATVMAEQYLATYRHLLSEQRVGRGVSQCAS